MIDKNVSSTSIVVRRESGETFCSTCGQYIRLGVPFAVANPTENRFEVIKICKECVWKTAETLHRVSVYG